MNLAELYVQVTKLKETINKTIEPATHAVNEIYEDYDSAGLEPKRDELIEQTEQAYHLAAEVLDICQIGDTGLQQYSEDLPTWVACFKEFIHYRCALFVTLVHICACHVSNSSHN